MINRRHGEGSNGKESPEYRCWANMLSRCENPNHRLFKHYGARGISVCERWHTYESFLADMGRRPSPEHSIDRIDNAGNYEPGNCRWATGVEQNRNTRGNRMIEIDGERLPLAEWLERTGVPRKTFYNRIKLNGLSERRALGL